MFDWELQNYLNERNNTLTSDEYMYICGNCPQLNHIKYDPFENCFEAWSDYNYFKFQVYPETH